MKISITDAGIALLNAGTGPVNLTVGKLGSAYGYTPDPTDTDIHGTEVYAGTPSAPIANDANTYKYVLYLDYNLGPFDFGELGLFTSDGTLFALGAASELISKIAIGVTLGNSIRIDVYLSIVGQNYDIWLNSTDTANPWRMGVLGSVDNLPQSQNATPNAYIVSGASSTQSAFIAYTDRSALWNFDAYQYASTSVDYVITGLTSNSVTIDISQYSTDLVVQYFGQRILQFINGPDFSYCRYVQQTSISGNTVVLTFQSNLAKLPNVGDKFRVFSRNALANSNVQIPIATTTDLGGIVVSDGLAVTPTGELSVDTSTIPGGVVVSVNGMQGIVTLDASDVPGTVRTVNGTLPDANGNVNTGDYTLPIASATAIGGVRIPNGGSLVINPANGDLTVNGGMVNSVNGQTGIVTIIGLVGPVNISANANLNTFTVAGLYFTSSDADAKTLENAPFATALMTRGTLEVIPLDATGANGDLVQRWQQQGSGATRTHIGGIWGAWITIGAAVVPIASTTSLGVVQIGAGINVTAGGLISTVIQSVNGKASQFVILNADDVGAISLSAYEAQGGVPQLGSDPDADPPDQNLSDYNYNRIRAKRLPFEAMQIRGDWDASANTNTYTDVDGDVHTVVLATGGQLTDTDTTLGTAITGSGEGVVMRVSTAGTTALDGITSWAAGDYIAGWPGAWVKLVGGGSALPIPAPVGALTATRTLAIGDANMYLVGANAAAATVTVPTNATAAFTVGTEIHIRQNTVNQITLAAASGVTINLPYQGSLALAGQGATVTLKKIATDVWDLFGVTTSS